MAHPSLFIDALQYNNWSEEVFKHDESESTRVA